MAESDFGDLLCDWNERVEFRMTPKLQTSGDWQMVHSSILKRGSPTFQSSALGATTMSSVLLLSSLSRLDDIQIFILCRQLTRDHVGS